ncbi:response regulator transcription factor [Proteiniborus ethanoligenes]|nr:response regulator transcription factor [Proteiniborus ethanoligenes]
MIVDDQRLMREGLKTILDLEEDISVIELADTGEDALRKIKIQEPDVVLMDIRMPVMDGVECTAAIKRDYPHIKVVILTTFDDDEYIIDALCNGAEGYILKDLPSEKLISSIRDVYNGNSIMQPEIAAKVIACVKRNKSSSSGDRFATAKGQSDELTDREKEILTLVARGMNNNEIAKSLYLSVGTVKNHIRSIYEKIDVNERSKAIIYAMEHHYLD